ncbi:DUF928 domain-containing protein [Oxynema sp. CENA135]|uniref:DUF928 domain-containing protein n=1 Tax=Oxynema sp. CENA135 TaxID=984206 RepID=UPI0019098CFC|nr:DUF928 domain-containing protein [Oxynema sp. CENA135]MBK4732303.1 DUF928 domain-containing protein [Oxynema sp. CENA135]
MIQHFKKYSHLAIAFTILSSIVSATIFVRADEQIVDFSGTGRPNEQTDGGSRGNCGGAIASNHQLTALIPQTMSLTVSEAPTFWVYIPDDPKNLEYGELILQDEIAERPIYRIRYHLENTPGVVRLNAPSDREYQLEPQKLYRWYFKVKCTGGNQVAVGGLIERVTLPPSAQNNRGYLDNKIWHEILTEVGNRLRISPDNSVIREEWKLLLNAPGVDLKHIGDRPLVACCEMEQRE